MNNTNRNNAAPRPKAHISQWIKLARPHQWAKNALVFVPLLTAHDITLHNVLTATQAFSAFSFCASSVYILNDIVDIEADHAHPTKRNRPFASGAVSVRHGVVLIPLLLAVSIAIAATINMRFLGVLAAYYLATNAYTFVLKRKMIVDVVTLAGLYTARVLGGAAALGIPVSEWLLGFSMFIFLSLALVKRHSEMAIRINRGLPDPTNRDYKSSDLQFLVSLATASGFSAIIVLSLYISSPSVGALYHHPKALWLVIPIMIHWISRVIMLSHRGAMHDDPVFFALTDRQSIMAMLMVGIIGVAAL
jgi:4-hydroxybenzoate polyprenyltransferase